MKIVFRKPLSFVLKAAQELQARSQDGCFSPVELANECSVSVPRSIQIAEQLEELDLSSRLDVDWTAPRSGCERCVLNELRLTENREYEVLGIAADYYRIINDDGDPCLYHPELFTVSDTDEPEFWISIHGDEKERYSYPPEWSAPGFFERWHDGIAEARLTFDSVLTRRYGIRRRQPGGEA